MIGDGERRKCGKTDEKFLNYHIWLSSKSWRTLIKEKFIKFENPATFFVELQQQKQNEFLSNSSTQFYWPRVENEIFKYPRWWDGEGWATVLITTNSTRPNIEKIQAKFSILIFFSLLFRFAAFPPQTTKNLRETASKTLSRVFFVYSFGSFFCSSKGRKTFLKRGWKWKKLKWKWESFRVKIWRRGVGEKIDGDLDERQWRLDEVMNN